MNDKDRERRWLELIPFTAGAGLFIFFLLQVREVLSPLVILVCMVFVLYPIQQNRWARSLIFLAGGLFLVWVFSQIQNLLYPFVISFVLAYLLDPLIDRLERWKIPRTLAILMVVVLTLFALMGLGIGFVPRVLGELQALIDGAPEHAQRVQEWFQEMWGRVQQLNLPMDEDEMERRLLDEISGRWQTVVERGLRGVLNFTLGVTTFFVHVFNLIIIPFVTFYLLRDFDVIRKRVKVLLPETWSRGLSGRASQIEGVVGGYLRGQVLVCLVVAALTSLGLFFMGIEYSLLLGTVAGILNVVPYVGLALSWIIAGLVVLFGPSPLLSLVKVSLIFAVVQGLEGAVISPKILGQKMGLHPVVVMLSLLIFAHFFGFIGLILAIPATAMATLLFREWLSSSKEVMGED